MVYYPQLKAGDTIGVTASSSGVDENLHHLVHQSISKMEKRGYKIICGDTVWKQEKASAGPASIRGQEFNNMMKDPAVDMIIPPWGGELLIEILEYIDFKKMSRKWILGYSDISLLLLAITLKNGLATAHGTNFIDLRGESMDRTTAKWIDVLSTQKGESVLQNSSDKYQKKWDFERPSSEVFHLTEPTEWQTVSGNKEQFTGRFLGGCIDVIRHLIGTPYGDVVHFREAFAAGEPIIWYLENCEMTTADLQRTLVQMRLAGWFDHCSGLVFGRSSANAPVEDYVIEDVYEALSRELELPVVYDADCGHVPPQITFINGAVGKVTAENGKGSIEQWFI